MLLRNSLLLLLLTLTRADEEFQCSRDENGAMTCSNGDDFEEDETLLVIPGVEQVADGDEAHKTAAWMDETLVYLAKIDPSFRDECDNTHELCSFWAMLGECENNSGFMKSGCKAACRACDDLIEPDVDISDFQSKRGTKPRSTEVNDDTNEQDNNNVKVEDEGDVNETPYGVKQVANGDREAETQKIIDETPAYMQSVSPDLLKDCKNRHEQCAFWAVIGECFENPSYMKTNCAPSCRTCEMLDFETRCPPLSEDVNPLAYKPGEMNEMFEDIANGKFDEYQPTVWARPDNLKSDVSTQHDAETVMTGSDVPWVVTFDNFLTDEECDRMIELGYDKGYARSRDVGAKKFDGSFDGVESINRTSENAWCDNECGDDETIKEVSEKIAKVTRVPETNYEFFQILRYEVGQFYRQHHDFIPHQKNRNGGARILTFYVYLSDVEEGGGTNFPAINDLTVTPKKGKAVLWPSVHSDDLTVKERMTDHQALPVIAGTKFGANVWIHSKNYRAAHKEGCA